MSGSPRAPSGPTPRRKRRLQRRANRTGHLNAPGARSSPGWPADRCPAMRSIALYFRSWNPRALAPRRKRTRTLSFAASTSISPVFHPRRRKSMLLSTATTARPTRTPLTNYSRRRISVSAGRYRGSISLAMPTAMATNAIRCGRTLGAGASGSSRPSIAICRMTGLRSNKSPVICCLGQQPNSESPPASCATASRIERPESPVAKSVSRKRSIESARFQIPG